MFQFWLLRMVATSLLLACCVIARKTTPAAPKEPTYVLTHPLLIQPNHTFTFHLTLFEAQGYSLPVKFAATLQSNGKDVATQIFVQNSYGLNKHKFTALDSSIALDPNAALSVNVSFLTDGMQPSRGQMIANEQLLRNKFVFIQTDKAIYKPGDSVRIAVVVINSQLLPISGTKESIAVTDGLQNTIQALKDVTVNKFGMYKLQFTLSVMVNLGDWAITVTSSSGIVEAQKTFTVQFYVLPNIEVSLSFPLGFFVLSNNDANYKAIVAGTYTFGKTAAGSAVVTLQSTGCNWKYDDPTHRRLSFTVNLAGGGANNDGVFSLTGLNKIINPGPKNGIRVSQTCSLTFGVEFTEAATGKVFTTTNSIIVYQYPYAIVAHPSNPTNIKNGLPIVFRYQVTNPDGSGLANPQGISVKAQVYFWTAENQYDYRVECHASASLSDQTPVPKPDVKFSLTTDSNGVVTITIPQYPESIQSALFKLQLASLAAVQCCDSHSAANTQSAKFISVSIDGPVPSPIPVVGTVVNFKIQVTYRASWVYFILSENGQAIVYRRLSQPVSRSESLTTFLAKVTLTHEMAPRADCVVWTIEPTTSEVLADWQQFDIGGLVQENVEASFSPSTVRPGGETRLSISVSEPKSLIMMLAVDKRVQLLKTGNQILLSDVLNAITQSGNLVNSPGPIFQPKFVRFVAMSDCFFGGVCWPTPGGGDSAFLVFNNAKMAIYSNLDVTQYSFPGEWLPGPPVAEEGDKPPSPTSSTPAVRKNFPETWIWLSTLADAQGNYAETVIAPETITTYQLYLFAIGPTKGFGGVVSPTELTIFKDFFVGLDTKTVSIKRREEVQFNLLVYNYKSNSVLATVELKRSCDFEVLVDSGNGNFDYQSTDFIVSDIEVEANAVATVQVFIRATSLGAISFTVVGYANGNELLGDAAEITINVEAEGRIFYANKAILIQQKQGSGPTKNIITVDKLFGSRASAIVPGSKVFEIQVIGSPLGAALANLNQFVSMPAGCGEQTMIIMAPDVYIHQYLKAIGALTTELDVTIKTYAQKGYANELLYQRKDGGFSAFGASDDYSSTWLSAFVCGVFSAAVNELNTAVDPLVIDAAFAFINSQLQANGSFADPGRVIHVDMQGGARGTINLAAYIYAVMGETGRLANPSTRVLLVGAVNDAANTDPYQLALLSYAFTFNMFSGDKKVAKTAMNRLLSLASQLGGSMMYWKPKGAPQVIDEYTLLGQSAVETASYALLSLLKLNKTSEAIMVARWLMTQRNSLGGFCSTQDTVVGLKALAAISTMLTSSGENLQLDAQCTFDDSFGNIETSFAITTANAILLQSFDLPRSRQNLQQVEITSNGVGVALIQLTARYNLYKYDSGCYSITTKTVSGSPDTEVVVKTCIKSLNNAYRGMVVLELDVSTGMKPNLDATITQNLAVGSQTSLKNPLSSIELGTTGGIVFYFYELPSNGTRVCVNSVITRYFQSKHCDPPMATAYAYYAPLQCFTATQFTF